MKRLFIDIETYCNLDLAKVGVYKYASDPSFEILLFGYSEDGGDVKVVDLANGEIIPPYIIEALKDATTEVWAFNCAFERVCLSAYLKLPVGTYLNPSKFYCSMIHSAYLGLPLSLEKVGNVLEIENKKLATSGRSLVSYFCKPCEPKKSNNYRTRNTKADAPDLWEMFVTYNKYDILALIEIHKRESRFPLPKYVLDIYHLNEEIQDRGIRIYSDLVAKAIALDEKNSEEHLERATELTGLDNFNSPTQLKKWLIEQGQSVDTLGKADIKRLLEGASGYIEEALKLRQELAKTSNKKYLVMRDACCSDGKVHGTSQCYGSHTGRFAGRLLQTANLTANHLEDLDTARRLVLEENDKEIIARYGSISSTLSELIRTCIIPSDNSRFIVCDFSQVENRVAAYVCKSQYMLDAYAKGEDLYCAVASKLFGLDVKKDNENASYRKYGKICCLGLNYGAGVQGLKNFGAVAMGIKESELQNLVQTYRATNPEIVQAWRGVEGAAKHVIKTGEASYWNGFKFTYERGILFIELPSGRRLAYCKPRMGVNNFGGESIRYEGVGMNHKWELLETFGGKLFENLIQAFAADLLFEAMERLTANGYKIIFSVHDEVVIDAPNGSGSMEDVIAIMCESPSWCSDLLLKAEAYECNYYLKK